MIEHNDQKYYKLGLHIHTTRSDGKKEPDQVIALYKENGYDVIALTDHWVYNDNGMADDMLILSGGEFNKRGNDAIGGIFHIVGLGMAHDPQLERDTPAQPTIDAIRAAGGMAVLAHPAWSMNTLEQAKELKGIEATEVYNAVSEVNQSVRAYSTHFLECCANSGIYYLPLAADDAHYYEGQDACKGWVMAKLESLDRESVLKALRQGDFYSTQGPELYVRREGNQVIVDTSPCECIAIMTNMVWRAGRVARGAGLTHHEYTLKDDETWFRVEAYDAAGKLAWSNVWEV